MNQCVNCGLPIYSNSCYGGAICKCLFKNQQSFSDHLKPDELTRSYAFTKAQIVELESLRKENAALLVALVAKDAMLEKIACVGNGNSHGNSIGNCMAIEALAILLSTELLEQRDRKRDAKLLRAIASRYFVKNSGGHYEQIEVLASHRESGEWIPELGD